ncbi:ThiF family adenylyltransferase [bacterium]|nr:MAG: ThiF family adenylyltransferase [bacterium]
MNNEEVFARIQKLFDVELFSEAKVLVVGCGSGGGGVALQLVMSGIKHLTLVDKDVLEPANVIRHVCGRRFIGAKKVDALEEVLLDRNVLADVRKLPVDIMKFNPLQSLIEEHTVVVLATDNEPTRFLINELCVQTRTPFVVGRVFTRGIGGEVFSYRPKNGGCLACLERVLERTKFRNGIREIDLVSQAERDLMYGLEVSEIKDSPGLNVDISFITSFHTRFVLESIAATLAERPKYMEPIPENYLVWGNRPSHPFDRHFQIQRITLDPQEGCQVCSRKEE